MQLARERQRYVLGHMREDKYISDAEYQAALAEPIALVDESDLNHLASPYFVEHIRQLATQALRQQRRCSAAASSSTRRSTRACRPPPRARSARASSRSIAGSASAARSARSPQAQRGAWTGGPAHPITGANDDTSALADQLLPEQTLRRDGRRARRRTARRHRRSRPEAAAARRHGREGRARVARRTKDEAGRPSGQARRSAARAARPPTARRRRSRSVPRCRARSSCSSRATGRVVALVGGYDWTASQFDRATQAQAPGRLVDQAVHLRGRDRGRQDAGRSDDRRSVLGHDRDRRVDARELRQQVHGQRHADDRARVLAQHDQRAARRAGRPRSHHRDHARLRHHVADPAPHLDRARHARSHAARDRGGLRRHRERRPPRHAAVLRSRHRHERQRRRGSAQRAAGPAGHLARGRVRRRST